MKTIYEAEVPKRSSGYRFEVESPGFGGEGRSRVRFATQERAMFWARFVEKHQLKPGQKIVVRELEDD